MSKQLLLFTETKAQTLLLVLLFAFSSKGPPKKLESHNQKAKHWAVVEGAARRFHILRHALNVIA